MLDFFTCAKRLVEVLEQKSEYQKSTSNTMEYLISKGFTAIVGFLMHNAGLTIYFGIISIEITNLFF